MECTLVARYGGPPGLLVQIAASVPAGLCRLTDGVVMTDAALQIAAARRFDVEVEIHHVVGYLHVVGYHRGRSRLS